MNSVKTPFRRVSKPLLFVLSALFIFLWASGFIAAKYGLPYAEPFTLMAFRFAIGSLVLVPACWLLKTSWPLSYIQTFHLLIAGFGIQTVYLIGVYYGIYMGISTGIAALIVGLQPLLTGIMAGIFLKETVTRGNWFGLFLGFAGLVLIVWDRILSPNDNFLGMALLLLGLFGITVGTLYQKKYCEEFDVRSAVALQNVMSFIVMFILALCFEKMTVLWSGEFIFAVLWSAIGLSVIAICLYYWLVQRGAATKVTSLIYLSPPTTMLMGWWIFYELVTLKAVIGMVLAMTGVALVVRTK